MRSVLRLPVCAGLASCLVLCSCATYSADQFVLSRLSPAEKAEILVQKGIAIYNDRLMEKNDLKAVPEVRDYFENALILDPGSKQAETYLGKVDSFKTERFTSYLAYAQKLKDKKTRTDRENYELCLSVQRAIELNGLHPEAVMLKLETGDLRKQVIQKRVAALSELERKLMAEKNQAAIEKTLPQAAKAINEILVLDSGNKDAERSKKNLDAYVAARVKADVASAEASLARKDFPAARAAAERAERIARESGGDPGPGIAALKYRVAFAWAKELYVLKKYESASLRVNEAIALGRSAEALDLKNRIAKARAVPAKGGAQAAAPAPIDYDSGAEEMLGDIDARIAASDLAGAWELCADALSKLKAKQNIDQAQRRKASIQEKAKALYAQAVADYNAENYEDARAALRVVVKVIPGHEQSQAYLDRANNKLRALGGAE